MLFSCREELILDDVKNEKLIVVDGFIANTPRPYSVNLSYSSLTSDPKVIPVTGCVVVINDDKGNSEELLEIEPGIYSTSLTGIKGVIGNEYQLSIRTVDGKEYKSNSQKIKEIVEIDSVFANIVYLDLPDFPYGLPGYQFYIDTKEALNNNNYFLWNMSETYEYAIDNNLKYIETVHGNLIYSNPRYDTLRICWKTDDVKYFFTGKTTNLSIPIIKNKPLHFVSTESRKLSKRYSLLVNQFQIDKKAYNYWKNLEVQISTDDFLSTTQPVNINGNVQNTKNHKEKVLGYFTVASISSKRIFINRPFVPFYYPKCTVIKDEAFIRDFKRLHRGPYYFVDTGEETDGITYEHCLDCRNYGGKNKQPSFWIN